MNTIQLKEDLQIGSIVIREGTKLGVLDEGFRPDQVLYNGIVQNPGYSGGEDLAQSISNIAAELEDADFLEGLIAGLRGGILN